MKEVEWTTQDNPTSPNYYTKIHLTNNSISTICGTCIPTPNILYGVKFNDSKKSIKELLEREEKYKDKVDGSRNGIYCLKCLKKLSKVKQ